MSEFSIVVMDQHENVLQFLDPSRCEVKETCKESGLRTLQLEYLFINLQLEKELFKIGNKIWVSGDINIKDCLYVINTSIEEDIYKENTFSIELEEVLVELNNAPLFFQTELSKDNFKNKTLNGQAVTRVDYNALLYWFGDYFNLGVVQDCLSDYASWITITGSLTRMSLLRLIEEETGNVFVTRYEKDCLNNTIHRYLDFLNPITINKNWTLNLEYDFLKEDALVPTTPDNLRNVRRYIDGIEAESIVETVYDDNNPYDWYVKGTVDPNWVYNEKDETVKDIEAVTDYTPLTNLNPSHINIRITDGEHLLNTDGEIYSTGDDALEWSSSDVGFTSDTEKAVISLCMFGDNIGVCVNSKSFALLNNDEIGANLKGYVDYSSENGFTDSIANLINEDDNFSHAVLPDDSYLELYDTSSNVTVFRTMINREIGFVHDEVLDFNFNMTNVEFEIDESSTYTAVSPVINQSGDNALSRDNTNQLIQWWQNLAVTKGDIIPFIVEKSYVQANNWTNAVANVLGVMQGEPGDAPPYDVSTNYWWRPLVQNNQIDDSNPNNNKYEAWRAISYWRAPFDKKKGEMYISTDNVQSIDYTDIIGRNDTRDERGPVTTPKMGTITTSEEDRYNIYKNAVTYLKEHMDPKIDITVTVANLRDGEYNNYDVHDKVYIKLPDTRELITGRVIETVKEPNNPSKNTVKISNYTNRHTLKTIPQRTIINAQNTSFDYPALKEFSAVLENIDYNAEDPYSIRYLGNKLISFSIYKVENNNATWTGKTITKRTNGTSGRAFFTMDFEPGYYKIKITFGGDEEYEESSFTVNINVGGVKEVVTPTHTSPKPVAKADNNLPDDVISQSTTYYDQYGRSPDKKKICAIGRISAGRDSGSYANFYETEFTNKCPHCGKASLMWGIFWAGNEYSNWGRFPGTGRNEGGSAEGHIFCSHCDADYSVQGNEHVSYGKKLSVTKATKVSSKAEAYKLRNGKKVYEIKRVTESSDNITNSGNRRQVASAPASIKNKALSIVGNRTGLSAAQAIASWTDRNLDYHGYENFSRSPETVMKRGGGNCCDVTRLYLMMCDCAGCTEYLKLEYIHVYGHVYARVTVKSSGKSYPVDCASSHAAWDYICIDYRSRGVIHRTTYPTLPF